MKNEPLSLYDLTSVIKKTISDVFTDSYWIVAEISDINENRNGHAYLELIDKDVFSDKISAKAKAIIWAGTYRMLKPYFVSTTKQRLSKGLKILVCVSVEYHEVYGLSLTVMDIDPVYTLGDIERKRTEIIRKLEADGIFNMNKELELSDVPQRIAVISSPSAAGYGDFVKQVQHNQHGFKFYLKLFPAVMQGDRVEQSVIDALDRIFDYEELFDAVVIIRGGGSKSDLSCFDNYLLSSNVAQFPLPIITGIGHDRDETIVDLVAHKSMKTPTAVADFLVSKALDFENELLSLQNQCIETALNQIEAHKHRLESCAVKLQSELKNSLLRRNNELEILNEKLLKSPIFLLQNKKHHFKLLLSNFSHLIENKFITQTQKLQIIESQLNVSSEKFLTKNKHEISMLEKTIQLQDPIILLRKGYSLTKRNGKIIKKVSDLNVNDRIQNQFIDGEVEAIVVQWSLSSFESEG